MSINNCERCHEYAEDGGTIDEHGFYVCWECDKKDEEMVDSTTQAINHTEESEK